MWQIIAFESRRGEKPVEKLIKSLDKPTIAKVTHDVDLLEKHGYQLEMPHSKKLTKDLYELRTRGRQEIRILYTFAKNKVYLLHAFQKKTQKTPQKEITIALKRIQELTIV